MSWLFASGHAADIVLMVMAAEAALLAMIVRRSAAAMLAILPGALILLALRAALVDAGWMWVALPLMLSLPAHLADLRLRGFLGRGSAADGKFGQARYETG